MRLRTGEVLQRRSPRVERHHAQVDLQALRHADGRLGRAAGNHLMSCAERRHQRGRIVRGGQDVDVADGFPPAPQRARVGAALAAGDGGQRLHHGGRGVQSHVEQDPFAALAVHLDAAGDALFAAGAEPGQALQPTRLDRPGQLVHRRDAQVVVELQRPLRPEAGHPGQLEHPGRDLGPQFVQGDDAPGGQVLGDLGRDRGAHAGDGAQALGVELADVLTPATDRPGRLLVVPGPEHVAAGDLGQLGVLPEQPRDFLVEPGHGITLFLPQAHPRRGKSTGGRRCRPPCRPGPRLGRWERRARHRPARGRPGEGSPRSVRHQEDL